MYLQRSPPFQTDGLFTTEWWFSHLTNWQAQCPALLTIFEEAQEREDAGRPLESAIVSHRSVPEFVRNVEPEGIVAKIYDEAELRGEDDDGRTRSLVVGLLQIFEPNLERLVEEIGLEEAANLMSRALTMPLHLSTEDEIRVMIGAIECLLVQLKGLGRTPSFVTLARSPFYTPVHSLKTIECGLLQVISRQFPDIRSIYHENSLDADYATCELGFKYYDIGSLVSNNFAMERTNRGISMPVEIIVANTSPELLVMSWKDPEGNWLEQLRVPAYSYDGENWLVNNLHVLKAVTSDNITVSELTVDAEQGHTQLWVITTGEVDVALKNHSIVRHRDI
jgi:hypothetical protein